MSDRVFLLVHGKGGGPNVPPDEENHIVELYEWLKRHGTVVYNEYPWGYTRRYNDTLEQGLQEVINDYNSLKAENKYVYTIGHSLGGNILIQLAQKGLTFPDGLILSNPAHNVGNPKFKNIVDWSVKKAKRLVEEGKGKETSDFVDILLSSIEVCYGTSESYLSFFDPDGMCNMYNYDASKMDHQHFLWIHSENDTTQMSFPRFWSGLFRNSGCVKSTSPTDYHGPDPTIHFPSIIEWYTKNEEQYE